MRRGDPHPRRLPGLLLAVLPLHAVLHALPGRADGRLRERSPPGPPGAEHLGGGRRGGARAPARRDLPPLPPRGAGRRRRRHRLRRQHPLLRAGVPRLLRARAPRGGERLPLAGDRGHRPADVRRAGGRAAPGRRRRTAPPLLPHPHGVRRRARRDPGADDGELRGPAGLVRDLPPQHGLRPHPPAALLRAALRDHRGAADAGHPRRHPARRVAGGRGARRPRGALAGGRVRPAALRQRRRLAGDRLLGGAGAVRDRRPRRPPPPRGARAQHREAPAPARVAALRPLGPGPGAGQPDLRRGGAGGSGVRPALGHAPVAQHRRHRAHRPGDHRLRADREGVRGQPPQSDAAQGDAGPAPG